ncbi:MAG: hypothetical protein SCH71_10825 [Desulfobulbaceae bacterium]|nr:hypothetical protein [Desulfobulbaceae bacterium]
MEMIKKHWPGKYWCDMGMANCCPSRQYSNEFTAVTASHAADMVVGQAGASRHQPAKVQALRAEY